MCAGRMRNLLGGPAEAKQRLKGVRMAIYSYPLCMEVGSGVCQHLMGPGVQTGLGSAVSVGLEDVSQRGGEGLLQSGIREPAGVQLRQREVICHGTPKSVCRGAVPCANESLVGFCERPR